MSNRLFQGIVHQMKDAIDRTIGVIDETSVVIACSELGKIGEVNESVNSEITQLNSTVCCERLYIQIFRQQCKV